MKVLIFLLALIISLTTIIADNPIKVDLEPGKNNLSIDEYFPAIGIKELGILHPEIRSASLKEYGAEYGYVNTLGGIGKNFLVEPGRVYEIHVNESITIYLKN